VPHYFICWMPSMQLLIYVVLCVEVFPSVANEKRAEHARAFRF
jgi:hypothetical protein